MTEWEQMKKEYRDVQIPASGPHQMLEAVAKAKRDRKRSRMKQAVRYSTVAAAVLLVVLLIPGIMRFSGGFTADRKDAATESVMDGVACSGSGQESNKSNFKNAGSADNYTNSMSPAISQDTTATNANEETASCMPEYSSKDSGGANGVQTEEAKETGERINASVSHSSKSDGAEENGAETEKRTPVTELVQLLSETRQDALCQEIVRQMEERGQQGEIFDTKYDTLTWEVLLEGQSYYIREDGLLVIVYAAGSIAPESQGEICFVIPKEVINIEETR